MTEPAAEQVTRVLAAIGEGDQAAADQLLPLVYDSLRRLAQNKIAQESPGLTLELERNADILSEVVQRKGNRTVVGFAAETHDVLENARTKLRRKGCDLIVANDVSRADVGFDVDQNEVWIVGPGSDEVIRVPIASKTEVAARILDRIEQVRKP